MADSTPNLLMAAARSLCDERPGGASVFITDTEGIQLANRTFEWLRSKLIAARGQRLFEAATPGSISVVAGTAAYNVPTGAGSIIQIWWVDGDLYEEVPVIEYDDIPRVSTWITSWDYGQPKGYRVVGSKIQLFPTPDIAFTLYVRYVTLYTDLTGDQTMSIPLDGWREVAEYDLAAKIVEAREDDPTSFRRQRDEKLNDLLNSMSNVTQRSPQMIIDVSPEAKPYKWWPPFTE